MGKHRHTQDKLYISRKEWNEAGGGRTAAAVRQAERLRVLHPFRHCSLSLLPWTDPCCSPDGIVFDFVNIGTHLQKHKHNPVTGRRLKASELIRLHVHRNADGEPHCPVTYTVFNEHTKIVAIATSGHVYSYAAVKELNLDSRRMRCLMSDKEFTRSDILVLQDPYAVRDARDFLHVRRGETPKAEGAARADEGPVRHTEATARIMAQFQQKMDAADAARAEAERQEEREAAAAARAAGTNDEEAVEALLAERRRAQVEKLREDAAQAPGFTSSSFEKTSTRLDHRSADIVPKRVKEPGYVRMHTTLGDLNLELYCPKVPLACENFLTHIRNGYYTGTVFHRSIKNFMIQGGDPKGTGRGGDSIWGKPFEDEIRPNLTHKGGGVLSMANSGPRTNGSQFFITYKSAPHLDGLHTVFGRVVGGRDTTLKAMERVPTDDSDRPLDEIKITGFSVFADPFAAASAAGRAQEVAELFANMSKGGEGIPPQQQRGPVERPRRIGSGAGLLSALPAPENSSASVPKPAAGNDVKSNEAPPRKPDTVSSSSAAPHPPASSSGFIAPPPMPPKSQVGAAKRADTGRKAAWSFDCW